VVGVLDWPAVCTSTSRVSTASTLIDTRRHRLRRLNRSP
jgi:hypothetical protein